MSHSTTDYITAAFHAGHGLDLKCPLASPKGRREATITVPVPSCGTQHRSAVMSGPTSKQFLRGRNLPGNISRLSNSKGSAGVAMGLTEGNGQLPGPRSRVRGSPESPAPAPGLRSSCFSKSHAHPWAVTCGKRKDLGEGNARQSSASIWRCQVPGLKFPPMLCPGWGVIL